MKVLGTFQSRDAADAVKDAFVKDGFALGDLIVMTNRTETKPPEDAKLEVAGQNEGGFAGLEEKIGKAVLRMTGKPNAIEGDGFEGEGKGGALLSIRVADDAAATRAKALLERHFAGDVEVTQAG